LIADAIAKGSYQKAPFPYYISEEALTKKAGDSLLDWFGSDAPWKLVETGFYEQYEFSFFSADLPSIIAALIDRPNLERVKGLVQDTFGVVLSDRMDVTAHKLLPGQRIRLHNDYIPGEETHRVLVQLNRGWDDENGGLLMFFNSSDPADIHKVLRPNHNSCTAFEISPDSNHAVTTIHGGERFTLVYSFYKSLS
jgi:Rps23 Pro-64 3,4-dihydroxylase Tpa1-like proline 4-hydroxylase